jgi:hypothetical protein
MQSFKKRYYRNKLIVETDFVQGVGWCADLVRSTESRIGFLLYESDPGKVSFSRTLEWPDRMLYPPEEDELMRNMRLPRCFGGYKSVGDLLQQIDAFLSRCLDLEVQLRFVLACFVLSTWVIDRLPLAPYIAFVGLPQSGKTTALKALRLLCRRGVLTSDITSAAMYRACDRLMPTLCIDETATAGQRRTLFHLLRSGNVPDSIAFRESQSYRTFCAKVVTWTELPDDDALNSRCLIVPMQESSRTDLLRTTHPELIAAADSLQGQLLAYRFVKYNTLQLPQIPGDESLRSRNRDLYEALALPIGEDPESCARLLECMKLQHAFHRQPLSPDQAAVLETLFQQIHAQADQGKFSIRDLTKNINLNLKRAGEHFQLNPRGVGAVLTTLGFLNRTRTSSGWVVWLDRSARKRIHELILLYGADGLADCLPSKKRTEPCDFCKISEPQSAEIPPADGSTSIPSTESAGLNAPGASLP